MKKLLLNTLLIIGVIASAAYSGQLHATFKENALLKATLYATLKAYESDTNTDLFSIMSFTAAALGIQITTDFITALAHELGHAITAKLLTDKDVEVIMGSHNPHDKTVATIARTGILPKISIKGLSGYGGTLRTTHKNRFHETAISAAGPIAGCAASLVFVQSYAIVDSMHLVSPLLTKLLSMSSACSALHSLINLIPFDSSSDGYSIAKNALLLPKKQLEKVNAIGSCMVIPTLLLGMYLIAQNF